MNIILTIVLSCVAIYAVETTDCKPTIQPPLPSTSCCGVQERDKANVKVYGSKTSLGGNVVSVRDYPWLALVVYNHTDSKWACGGTLISSRFVLTVATCLDKTSYGWPHKVRLGEYNTTSHPTDLVETVDGGFENITVVEIDIKNVLRHPGYKNRPIMNDIGLVQLMTNAPFNDFIRPICLPTSDINTFLEQNFILYAAGWGRNPLKRQNKLPYVTLANCQIAYRAQTEIVDSQICAGGEVDNDSCNGDSGNPLMYKDGDKFTIVGIVSFGGRHCGTEGIPGVHTNVFKHLYWIINNMKFLSTE